MGHLVSALAPTAAVLPYAATTAPDGWLLCDGSAVSRTTYSFLFAAIGTSYGSGDGSTTFNVPDYRWTFLRGFGANISVTGSGSASSNQATFTAHGFNRTGVKVRLSSGTLSGLAASTDYWVIVVDANTLAFATSKANAITNTRVAISGVNSAIIVQFEDPNIANRTANTSGANFGGGVGSHQFDQMQGHRHPIHNADQTASPNQVPNNYVRNTNLSSTSGDPVSDGINGTPRTGFETRPSNLSINYIIKF